MHGRDEYPQIDTGTNADPQRPEAHEVLEDGQGNKLIFPTSNMGSHGEQPQIDTGNGATNQQEVEQQQKGVILPDLKILKLDLDVVPKYRGKDYPPRGSTDAEIRKFDAWERRRDLKLEQTNFTDLKELAIPRKITTHDESEMQDAIANEDNKVKF